MKQVDEFAHERGMEEHAQILRKGALVAQDPSSYEDISGAEKLDQEEIDALQKEVLHKWRVPRLLYLTIITCSIGAAVQGWDQTGSNGANLSFPTAFGIGDKDSQRDTYLVGLVNSAPYIGSAYVFLSHPIESRTGRYRSLANRAQASSVAGSRIP